MNNFDDWKSSDLVSLKRVGEGGRPITQSLEENP